MLNRCGHWGVNTCVRTCSLSRVERAADRHVGLWCHADVASDRWANNVTSTSHTDVTRGKNAKKILFRAHEMLYRSHKFSSPGCDCDSRGENYSVKLRSASCASFQNAWEPCGVAVVVSHLEFQDGGCCVFLVYFCTFYVFCLFLFKHLDVCITRQSVLRNG